jgi:branched-chain amino acid transport system permease protein
LRLNRIQEMLRKRTSAIIIAVLLLGLPFVVESRYYIHMLIMVLMNAVLAMTFVMMLRTGLISLCIATFWGIGAYASTLLAMKWNVSFWLALPAATIVTAVVALCLGLVLVRNAGFNFIAQTVVLSGITVLFFGQVRFFGGYEGIVSIPAVDPIVLPLLPRIEFAGKTSYYYLIVAIFGFVTLAYSAFYASWAGRAWRSIGLNSDLAKSLGVDVYRYRLLSFVVASATAGMVGSFYAHYYGAIVPTAFDLFKTIYTHIYAILGGIAFPFLGPLVGAFFMIVVPELLRVVREIEPIYTGIILILTLIFLPNGLLSLVVKRPGAVYSIALLSRIKEWSRRERRSGTKR